MLGTVFLISNVGIFQLPRPLLLLLVIVSLLTKPNKLLERFQCPDCFGSEMCESIANGEIQLNWFSNFLLVLHPNLTKSVYFGKLNKSKEIVLKSMTRRGEIRPKRYESLESELLHDIVKDNILIDDDDIRNVVLCPNVESLQKLFGSVDEKVENLMQNRNLWLDIQISIEPLLMKHLSSIEGMPVPKYYGACGDVIANEFKGNTLNNYYNQNWTTRAFLSVQLLKMAEIFTFHHESLIFYFTDISSDNIVVDATDMIYLVDLDHVIIAERKLNYSGDLARKDTIHTSAVVDPTKLTVSPSDICKHLVSDHNYFAVCRYILRYSEEVGQGLLPDVPSEILERHQNLQLLLDECAQPKKYENRIVAGRLLRKGLNEAISIIGWKEYS